MIDVVIGVDSSTQSCTVEVRNVLTGELVSTASAPHPATFPPVSEQHPDAWWAALVLAVRTAVSDHDVRVVGMGVGAQCHGLVVLGEDAQVLRTAKLWNDTTSAPQSNAMIERFGSEWWSTQIGLVPGPAITITKLLWLKENDPDTFDHVRTILVPHDWLTYRLTGRFVTDRTDASGTGYFSADTMTWRTDILTEVVGARDWNSMLPTVLAPEGTAGRITPEAAAELGISPDAIVSAGGGDQHLAATGIGLTVGDIAYSLGTSGVVLGVTDDPVKDPTGAVDGVANVTGGYLPIVCTLNATKVTDTIGRLLGVDHVELGRLALSAPLDPKRPILAAYLDGERSPRMPWAHGLLGGLTTATTREQFALAGFEGVALGLVRGERILTANGISTSGRTIIVGGGARAETYRQVIADLIGRDVLTVDAPEATARGAAVQAAAVVRGETVAALTTEWAPPVTSTTHPQHDRNDLWERYLPLADLQADGASY